MIFICSKPSIIRYIIPIFGSRSITKIPNDNHWENRRNFLHFHHHRKIKRQHWSCWRRSFTSPIPKVYSNLFLFNIRFIIREEATTSRDIRTQQDQAYLNSLAADREKARIAAQLKLEQEQAEKEVERKLIEKETLIATKLENRKRLIETLKPEPKEDEDGITKLSIRLPNGSRIVRRFFGDDDVEVFNIFFDVDKLGL